MQDTNVPMSPQARFEQWQRLPAEMRGRAQWLLAGRNGKGELKVPTNVDGMGHTYPGSSTDARTWLTFEQATEAAVRHGLGIGFCLHDLDPFTCVDLDVKNHANAPTEPDTWTTPEQLQHYAKLVAWLGSYSELSQSRQGLHVWCQGKIGRGVKRKGVEVYSQERFMVCTGLVVHDLPIACRQQKLDELVSAMRQSQAQADAELDENAPQDYSDDAVMSSFWYARNAEKFRMLWRGEWQAMGYPSQSEADQALMTQLAFYSLCNEQCRRLFRRSALGQRDKAVKDDRYLDLTLRRSRATHAPRLAATAAIAAAMAPSIDAALAQRRAKAGGK